MVASHGREERPLLGEVLLGQGVVAQECLDQALRIQAGGTRRLGHLLVKMKCISEGQLLEALSQQLGIPVVRPEEEFTAAVRGILPRRVCRRFAVIPLALEENNVLRLAMADPLDDAAVREVENRTGRAVRPVLSSLGDIEGAIGRRMAFSLQDLFNPGAFRRIAQIGAAAAVVSLLAAGYLLHAEGRRQEEGTVSRVGDSVIYRNHDLMVDISPGGEIYFTARGTLANGYFGVRFESADAWATFVTAQRELLSDRQRQWLTWLLREKIPHTAAGWGWSPGPLLAARSERGVSALPQARR